MIVQFKAWMDALEQQEDPGGELETMLDLIEAELDELEIYMIENELVDPW